MSTRTTPILRGLPPSVPTGRCLVIGVLNVTPDSFSDGGAYPDVRAAVQHGRALLTEGADLVDVGGESTRPGAARVDEAEEQRRVLPVIRDLAAGGAVVSVDTMRASTAAAAIEAGACLVNDVSGGRADHAMARLVASTGTPIVLMHWRGHSDYMQDLASYDDVVKDVTEELRRRVDAMVAAGVDVERIVLDPGLGFAKTAEHNWALLGHLADFVALGRPLLVGASRKRFLGELLAGPDGTPRAADRRDAASGAVTALAAAAGAWGVRVHDAASSADAVRVARAVRAAGAAGASGTGDTGVG